LTNFNAYVNIYSNSRETINTQRRLKNEIGKEGKQQNNRVRKYK
jgi:hypothetical protein